MQRCGVCTSAVSSKRVDDRPIVSSNDYLPSTSAPQRPDVEDGMHRYSAAEARGGHPGMCTQHPQQPFCEQQQPHVRVVKGLAGKLVACVQHKQPGRHMQIAQASSNSQLHVWSHVDGRFTQLRATPEAGLGGCLGPSLVTG